MTDFLRNALRYEYLGDCRDSNNSSVDEALLRLPGSRPLVSGRAADTVP